MMENLRWILLAIGILLVLGVYLWGRSRKKSMDYSPLDAANDVPSFSARDASDDDWRDGVGPVRVVHRERVDDVIEKLAQDDLPETIVESNTPVVETPRMPGAAAEFPASADKVANDEASNTEAAIDDPAKDQPVDAAVPAAGDEPEPDPGSRPTEVRGPRPDEHGEHPPAIEVETREAGHSETGNSEADMPSAPGVDDVVALYIVADRGHELRGEQILGACVASQLEYGDMKIFHRMDSNHQPVFSMANMMEPGWFDYDTMHELKTRGITLFTQLRLCRDPVQALDDMLVCAHSLATMLSAQLCGPDRQLLNEVTAKSLREKARHFEQQKHGNA